MKSQLKCFSSGNSSAPRDRGRAVLGNVNEECLSEEYSEAREIVFATAREEFDIDMDMKSEHDERKEERTRVKTEVEDEWSDTHDGWSKKSDARRTGKSDKERRYVLGKMSAVKTRKIR